ncbi:hypothetical protein [Saccharothrix hoggarensis]|uniref:Uncharacterized protein n=1 Tax=Saccharothrix hoggarensis TaxID=913853 RepID=A0ABW3QG57_9PSEU
MLSTVDSAPALLRWHSELITVTGVVASHCDRAEHVEQNSRAALVEVAVRTRSMAVALAAELDVDLRELYADRLARREAGHVLAGTPGPGQQAFGYGPWTGSFDGGAAVRSAVTWREWQQAQWWHDVTYLPDVAGMSRRDQLSHFGHHLAKLVWRMQEAIDIVETRAGFVRDRLPDILLFGIKLSTVVNDVLPQEPIEL